MKRVVVILVCAAIGLSATAMAREANTKPNILWLVSEDHGPHLGCYGDPIATTPNVDKLAKVGLKYAHCWSNAPVCAAARSTLITGVHAPSMGCEDMRCMVPFPRGFQMFPQFLREAGYYCSNNAKEDYNLAKPGRIWDESSAKAHWKNRADNQPYFAVFNSEKSHESKIRTRPHTQVHDPAKVRIPAYHPATPEVRQDWAQYYDAVTEADADAGRRLQELEAAGLTDQTIIFYFADHGSGMPRSKRWSYDSGLHVPLIVYIPEAFRDLRPEEYVPGGTSDRLVSFVDFAPTLLSIAGIEPPRWMQGHAFLGKFTTPRQPFLYGYRGRMDERIDLVRSVTDGRYVYLRQYMPHLIYGQHINYMFQTPTTTVWKQLHDSGKLTDVQDAFWNRKPFEELYDLQTDRDEVHNLAQSPDHQNLKVRLRTVLHNFVTQIRDVGFVPEADRLTKAGNDSLYEFAHDDHRCPIRRVIAAADLASSLQLEAMPTLKNFLTDDESTIRYWGVMGILMRGDEAVLDSTKELHNALRDESPSVGIAAAMALAEFGRTDDLSIALPYLLNKADWSRNSVFVCIAALNCLDTLGNNALPTATTIRNLPSTGPTPDARLNEYVPRLLESLNSRFQ